MSTLILVLAFLAFTGCTTMSYVESAIAGPRKKRDLLVKDVESFHQHLYWGSPDLAANHVTPEERSSFISKHRKRREKERFVDMEVESIEAQEEPWDADVFVRVRYFRIPTYIVETRRERERWQFNRFSGGWEFMGSTVLRDDEEADEGAAEISG